MMTWVLLVSGVGLAMIAVWLVSHAAFLHSIDRWADKKGLVIVDKEKLDGLGPFQRSEVYGVFHDGEVVYVVYRVTVRMKDDPAQRLFRGHLCMPTTNHIITDVMEHWDDDRPMTSLLKLEDRGRDGDADPPMGW